MSSARKSKAAMTFFRHYSQTNLGWVVHTGG